jgi:hypothetical protein
MISRAHQLPIAEGGSVAVQLSDSRQSSPIQQLLDFFLVLLESWFVVEFRCLTT